MEIVNKENEFNAIINGEKAGLINYSIENTNLKILHTEVNPEHRGEGVGEALVEAVASFARDNDYSITPYCTYAKHILEKNNEKYGDILQ